ncbi:MAG: PilN domain-containing protein [Rhodoferax sp.]|nr:PilN domain-containing protein [Rhodoferax sp.]
MILLNLLPHRELARKKKREQFIAAVTLAALVGVGISLLAFSWYQAAISNQRTINATLDAEILTLDQQIKDIKGLESQIAALQARQRTVEDVQADRNQSVHLLSELALQVPAGVLLTKATQTDQTVLISGTAQSNEQVSDLLRNLASGSAWFSKPELLESVAAPMALSGKDQRTFFNFSLRAVLIRAPDAAGPALPGSAASATGLGQTP